MKLTKIEQEVEQVLKQRRIKGRLTYGQGIKKEQNTTLGWVDEAINEATDLLVYLVALKEKIKNGNKCKKFK